MHFRKLKTHCGLNDIPHMQHLDPLNNLNAKLDESMGRD